jgi:predicted MFS family arabinose efflux permease
VATVPIGRLTDRVNRVRLLSASIALWAIATLFAGASRSYEMLLVARIALGAVAATVGPTLSSLTGDLFPAAERAKAWGMILGGELVGAGVGFLVSGSLAGFLTWRWAFWWLALPGFALAVLLVRMLPEPERGKQGCVKAPSDAAPELARRIVRRKGVAPDRALVLREDPDQMTLADAVRYVLRVRTNVVLIVSSALGYFFFAGVQTFTVVLLRARFHVGQSAASALAAVIGLGALMGVLVSGRLADRMLRRGRIDARILVAASASLIATALLVPALLSTSLAVSLPLFVLAAAALAATNPPLNAARLDIMHPRLWGRAEGVRTFLQMAAVASAPLVFGVVSTELGGPSHAVVGEHVTGGRGIALTFLTMLGPLAAGGLIALRARRTYPRDVATAAASADALAREARPRAATASRRAALAGPAR